MNTAAGRRRNNYMPNGLRLAQALLLALLCLGGGYRAEAAPAANAADDLQRQILAGQDALYQGDFTAALQTFTALTQAHPTDPKGYFFLALTYRWLTRVDPEAAAYQQQFEQTAATTIRLAQSLLAEEGQQVEALLYLAAIYGYRAEYYNFAKERWSKAYDDGVKMREYLEKAAKLSAADNLDVQLGYGLYNYYAYFYREKIGWWRFLLSLPKGDKQKGLAQIRLVREKGTYLKVEAWYFLVEIYKKDKELAAQAVPLCEELHQAYPAHPFFHIFLAGLYHQHRDWQKSRQTGLEILARAETNPAYASDFIRYQARYLIGESSFYLGQYPEALQQFDAIAAARPSQPAYLVPWAHLRRGAIYDLTGKKREAAAEYKLVLASEDVFKVHEMAEGLLKVQQNKGN